MSDREPDDSERLRTCGQHPKLGDVTRQGSRACGRVLSLADLYRCGDCQTAFCRDCLRRHFQDETPEAREATRRAQLAADADGDDNAIETGDVEPC